MAHFHPFPPLLGVLGVPLINPFNIWEEGGGGGIYGKEQSALQSLDYLSIPKPVLRERQKTVKNNNNKNQQFHSFHHQ